MKKYIAQIEPWIGKEEEREVISVLRSGWITENIKTKEFEEQIASFTGASYASIVCNGTVSLFAGLFALSVGKGDEVIVPDFTMIASPNAILLTGAKPVFVDIDKETLCMDLAQVEKKITKKTKVIMPVSLNGRSCDMNALLAIAKRHNIFVLEDAAQAFGSYYMGKHLGTFGHIGSFSFSTPKVITTGQGGALVTNSKKLYEKIIRVKDFGRIKRDTHGHDEIGFNFKFSDILSAIGIAQMKKLKFRLKRKKEMFRLYKMLLQNIEKVKFIKTNLQDVSPWFIDIIVEEPKKLQNFLKTQGIGSRLFYPAIHTTKSYKSKEKFPNSIWAANHGLWLPSSSFLSDSDIMRICNTIHNFYDRK